jgi:hypothetical protein
MAMKATLAVVIKGAMQSLGQSPPHLKVPTPLLCIAMVSVVT